ncbi:hypothetical protein [Profundibacter amoris]|nr:hypothetical protein [Profundibacter amoris]
MRVISFVKEVLRVTIIVCMITQVTAKAQGAPKEPFCAKGEKYYPEGLIGKIGSHFFRICTQGFAYPPLMNRPNLTINSEQRLDAYAVENFPDIHETFGRIRNHYGFLEALPGLRQNPSEKVGQIELGGFTYQVFVPSINLSRLTVPVSKENMPREFDLVFPGSDARDIPEHILTCVKGDPMNAPEKGYHCFLYIRYTPSEILFITKQIIHIPRGEPSYLINTRPFDFDRLAFLAQQLRNAYRHIEITDQLNELKDVPIIQLPE